MQSKPLSIEMINQPSGRTILFQCFGITEFKSMKTVFAVLLLASTATAADPQIQRDVPYVEPKNERQTLDVYAPAEGKNHPVIVWVHGGGWTKGSKNGMQKKPAAFAEKGFVFVPINYRFVPNVTVKEMTADIAKAIHWVHDHAKEFGGDPNSIVVMGHSAGAHLAALVCTDDRYLTAEGLSLSIIKGCVPIDVSVYDIPKRLKDGGSVSPETFKAVFGETEEIQRDLSPAAHIAKGKNIPSFLILHVADRADTKAQSDWIAGKLVEAGVSAKVVGAEGKNHGTINSDLGLPDDKPTKELFEFLDGVLKKKSDRKAQ
jgi:acetyl esterase/lipase